MAKKEKLGDLLQKGLEAPFSYPPVYDVRDEADMLDAQEQAEPMDKVMVHIQNLLISGDYESASALIKQFRSGRKKGSFFSYHHLKQLINWVRHIYKYTNMRDLSYNYYDYSLTKEMGIPEMEDLKKVKVRDDHIEKFMKDVERVLKKKFAPR
jgi:hypothetical protein